MTLYVLVLVVMLPSGPVLLDESVSYPTMEMCKQSITLRTYNMLKDMNLPTSTMVLGGCTATTIDRTKA